MCQAIGFDQGRDAKDSALGHLHDEQQSSKLLPLVAPPYRVRSRDITDKARQAVLFVEGIESVRSPSICRDAKEPYFRWVSCASQLT